MQFLAPFGPLLGRSRVPEHLVDHLNRSLDHLLTSGQPGELLLSDEITEFGGDDSLGSFVRQQIQQYVHGVERTESANVLIHQFWAVSQYENTASPMHFHSDDLSGVMYLKVPTLADPESERNYISGRRSGEINFLIGGKQRFSRSLISFAPQVADFLIFPAWLLHGAEPFDGTGERRSLAFNASIVDS